MAGVREQSGYKFKDLNEEMKELMKDKDFLLDEEIQELENQKSSRKGKFEHV